MRSVIHFTASTTRKWWPLPRRQRRSRHQSFARFLKKSHNNFFVLLGSCVRRFQPRRVVLEKICRSLRDVSQLRKVRAGRGVRLLRLGNRDPRCNTKHPDIVLEGLALGEPAIFAEFFDHNFRAFSRCSKLISADDRMLSPQHWRPKLARITDGNGWAASGGFPQAGDSSIAK